MPSPLHIHRSRSAWSEDMSLGLSFDSLATRKRSRDHPPDVTKVVVWDLVKTSNNGITVEVQISVHRRQCCLPPTFGDARQSLEVRNDAPACSAKVPNVLGYARHNVTVVERFAGG